MNLAYKGAYCDEIFDEAALNSVFTHRRTDIGNDIAQIFCADKITGYIPEYSCDFGSRRQSNFANSDPSHCICQAFGFKIT